MISCKYVIVNFLSYEFENVEVAKFLIRAYEVTKGQL